MKDLYFERMFAGLKRGVLKPAKTIKSRGLGFLYREDKTDFDTAVMFYTDNKKSLDKLIDSLIYTAEHNSINVSEGIDYILLGTVTKKVKGITEEIRVYIKTSDIYRVNENGEKELTRNIDELLYLLPEESRYLYSVDARLYTIEYDS